MAFEGFAELLSNTHGMKKWRKFRKYKAAGDTEAQAAALFPAVVDSLVDHYYGFVMSSVTGMHKAARNQRFYSSLVASYHGLSLMGMDILSSYGYTMPSSSFLRQREVALDNHDTTIRYAHDTYFIRNSLTSYSRNVEAEAHVTWWDNFSKMYRMRLADTARAMLADALWTGVAIRKYAGPVPVNMRCMYFGGYFVPAMPINPWSKVKDVLTMLDMLCTTSGDMSMLFEGSKMHNWGVSTIPITPSTHNLPAEVQSRLATTPTRLHNFYPKGLLPHNIGSNEGLGKSCEYRCKTWASNHPGRRPPSTAQCSRTSISSIVSSRSLTLLMKHPMNTHVLDDVRQERWR